MKNRGLKVFGGIVAVFIVGFIILTLSVDGIVKSTIEEDGSALLQTDVNVEDVDISLLDGTGVIYGFSVANPEGFSDDSAMQISETSIKIDLTTILSDQVVIKNIHIKNPELFFEQRGLGANLKKLNDNMDLSVDSGDTYLVIDHLLIENGHVRVSSTIDRDRNAEASITQFELNNIGREGSNTVKQSIRQIMEPLLERAMEEAVKRGLVDQLENKVEELIQGDNEE